MDTTHLPVHWTKIYDEGRPRELLERDVLPAYLAQSRWFSSKARPMARCGIAQLIPISGDGTAGRSAPRLATVEVEFEDGGLETYALPLHVAPLDSLPEDSKRGVILAHLEDGSVIFDGIHAAEFRDGLLRLIGDGGVIHAGAGTLTGIAGRGLPPRTDLDSRVLKVEQSNSSLIYADPTTGANVLFIKLYRKVEEGLNPDAEITRFLSERCSFAHVPPFAGSIEYRQPGCEPRILALSLAMVPNRGDAWTFALAETRLFFDRVRAAKGLPGPAAAWDPWSVTPLSLETHDLLGSLRARVEQLGRRTGEMHLALAGDVSDPAFCPERFSGADFAQLRDAVTASATHVATLVESAGLDSGSEALCSSGLFDSVKRLIQQIFQSPPDAMKIRTHGDYHLGQVLNTGDDFVILDFEGEPLRSIAERREKRSPLRDVAGMLRSFHYAAHSVLNERAEERADLEKWAEAFAAETSRLFLQAWKVTVQDAPFVPQDPRETSGLLDAFLLEKALYEVAYEVNNRPAWAAIPLRGLHSLVQSSAK